ncbi:hypothetical protein CPB83DRAFT_851662 [Crepidotus variabilis]|uniref:Ig-like domain-containing protein n=1 Tax=Crepidotus variabilis TaxID=179855 RepID=A0A9P6EJ43_9AGAR|nr:hypothetical protein CPB83DRAFT_851662 [Crepidotus variabilis]
MKCEIPGTQSTVPGATVIWKVVNRQLSTSVGSAAVAKVKSHSLGFFRVLNLEPENLWHCILSNSSSTRARRAVAPSLPVVVELEV